MVAGAEKYFQIARCFRDEDPRADRQAEFTQLDIEMSFVTQDDVIELMNGMYKAIWKNVLNVDIGDIPLMPYDEALNRFGIDRPDTRFGLELVDLSDAVRGCGFKVFDGALDSGGVVKAIRVPGGASTTSRARSPTATPSSSSSSAGGLPFTKVERPALGVGRRQVPRRIADKVIAATGCRGRRPDSLRRRRENTAQGGWASCA